MAARALDIRNGRKKGVDPDPKNEEDDDWLLTSPRHEWRGFLRQRRRFSSACFGGFLLHRSASLRRKKVVLNLAFRVSKAAEKESIRRLKYRLGNRRVPNGASARQG